jgi:hypothetical protein
MGILCLICATFFGNVALVYETCLYMLFLGTLDTQKELNLAVCVWQSTVFLILYTLRYWNTEMLRQAPVTLKDCEPTLNWKLFDTIPSKKMSIWVCTGVIQVPFWLEYFCHSTTQLFSGSCFRASAMTTMNKNPTRCTLVLKSLKLYCILIPLYMFRALLRPSSGAS